MFVSSLSNNKPFPFSKNKEEEFKDFFGLTKDPVKNCYYQKIFQNPQNLENVLIDLIETYIKKIENDYDWATIIDEFNINCIHNEGLIVLFDIIQKKQNDLKNINDYWKWSGYRRISFELKNAIFLRAWDNLADKDALIAQCNLMNLVDLSNSLTNMKKCCLSLNGDDALQNDTPSKIFSNATMEPLSSPKTLDLNHEKPRVLFSSLEYVGAKVGGVGTVATELPFSMCKNGQDARIITPLYNSYISDHYDRLEFVGIVKHPFKGKWIKSSIYATKTQDGVVTQYFAKSPRSLLKINDIGESNNIYTNCRETKIADRTQYLNSVSTAFASSYVGEDQNTPFQVLHTQSWMLSFAGELLEKHYNPMREKVGLNRLAHVAHVHGTGSSEQGRNLPKTIYNDLGLEQPKELEYANMNMQAHAYGTSSDCDIHPSNWSAESSKTKEGGYLLEELVNEKAKQGRLFGVQNGIARQSYDPTVAKIYGEFAFKQTIDNGVDKTDYVSQRIQAKQKLFDEKLISHPTKPLFLYVGRFDYSTKGLDALPPMIEQIRLEGGQCVVMGGHQGDRRADAIIKSLEKYQKKHPDVLKVYRDIKKDQLEKIAGTDIQKGKLIRLASDFVMVPSHKEADGLVPKEALTCGSLLVTSNVEGLSDIGRGLKDTVKGHTYTKADFNAFTYRNNGKFKSNAQKTISCAMKFFKNTSVEEKNVIISRIIKEAEVYDWKNSIAKVNNVYKKAIQKKNKDEVITLRNCESRFYRRHFSIFAYGKTLLNKLFIFISGKFRDIKEKYIIWKNKGKSKISVSSKFSIN